MSIGFALNFVYDLFFNFSIYYVLTYFDYLRYYFHILGQGLRELLNKGAISLIMYGCFLGHQVMVTLIGGH